MSYYTEDEKREQEKATEKKGHEAKLNQKGGCLVPVIVFVVLFLLLGTAAVESESGFLALLIFAIPIGIYFLFENKSVEAAEKAKAEELERVKTAQKQKRAQMESAMSQAKNMGFITTKKVTDFSNTYCIAIDNIGKKWLLKTPSWMKIFDYSALVDYELCQDGRTEVSGNAAQAITGGILFGTVGAIAGASGPKSIDQYCSEMYLSIVLYDASRVKIPLITSSTNKNSADYKNAVDRAKEMISILSAVKNH